LKFRYELEFPGAQEMDARRVCDVLDAGPGRDPYYESLGDNYVYLQYSNIQNYIVVNWDMMPVDSDDNNDNMDKTDEQYNWSYIVTLKPAVQMMGMRDAPKQLEALAHRVSEIRDRLVNQILPLPNGLQMDEQATVKAWLGTEAMSEERKESLFIEETDKISRAKVKYNRQWVPVTWVQLIGKKSDVLTAVYRWLKILET
jgi:hypothetical protein